jgi:hypothetical protein
MGDYVHRTTKQYLKSVSPNSLPEPLVNYIEDPDLSNVVGVPSIWRCDHRDDPGREGRG